MMRILITSIFYLFSTLVMAESGDKRLAPLGIQDLLETGGGLLLILVLIIGGAWLFKRYGQIPMTGKGLIGVLGGVSVGPRERVVLLRVDSVLLVVGVAPGQVRTLHVLDAEGEPETGFESQLTIAKQEEADKGAV